MTILEYENFHKADDERYVLNKNNEFVHYEYMKKCSCDFNPIINRDEMQDLINKIVMFYEFKYPNYMLSTLQRSFDEDEIKNALEIAKMLDLNELKSRLHHDYVQFLECSYGAFLRLKRPRKYLWELTETDIRVDSDGKIEPYDLENLKEYQFLDDITGITRIEDLYGRFSSIDTDVDYSELTRWIEMHKFYLTIRNKVLKVIPFALIYSKSTLPEYGYIRAKSFIRTFNKEFGLNMNLDELDEIMNRDYSGKQKSLIKRK